MKISVGIAFYNAELFLENAISSVLNQSFKDFELILMNDGSTDCSLEIAQKFTDPRIKLFSDGKNLGLAQRLNMLVELARGDYFARMDADDIMHHQRLETQLKYLEMHPDIDVLGSDAYSINTQNQVGGKIIYKTAPNKIEDICNHRCFIHPTIIAKRQWFLKNKYNIHANRMEDYELWIRTIKNSHFENIHKPLLFYRTEGLPYLSKYLESCKGERVVLRNLSENHKKYKKFIYKNYLKCLLYIVFSIFHITKILLKLRAKGMPSTEKEEAQKILNRSVKKITHE